MTPIVRNIMALAKEYRDAIDDHGPKRQALRTAIEQALGQGEPVAWQLKETLSRDDAPPQKCESRTPGKSRPDRECDDSDCWKIGGCSKLGADNSQAATPQPQREWVGLTAKDLSEIPPSCFEGAIWADAKLKEKNT